MCALTTHWVYVYLQTHIDSAPVMAVGPVTAVDGMDNEQLQSIPAVAVVPTPSAVCVDEEQW